VWFNEIIILMQADMAGSSPGALFEAVVKLSCEIIEFGWTKDRALVDTFIMRLAAYVRERNDYEEVFPFSLIS
jgi:phosphatidylinositol 4-kinase